MNIISNNHKPVLIQAVAEYSHLIKNKLNVFDGTFGGGGYSDFFLNSNDSVKVYACDLDKNAINYYFLNNLKNNNLQLVNDSFEVYISQFNESFFDIIVADLGYSSNQLDFSDRGFSYLKGGEMLDLRYDNSSLLPVYKKIRLLKSDQELSKIIFRYSGETFSSRIGKNLFTFITSTNNPIHVSETVEVIIKAIPKNFLHKKNAILSRVWQALRVWVNNEFDTLENFLVLSLDKLKPCGMLMITCFNSLEDKIVTKFMRDMSKKNVIDDFGNTEQFFEIITKKPITPSQTEIENNIRSRSATLRIIKKL